MHKDHITLHDAQRQVGKGWHELLLEAYRNKPKRVVIVEVKEKWGGLRITPSMADMAYYDLLDEIENRSLTICEVCGKPGKPTEPRGWIKTLCPEHAEAYAKGETLWE